MTTTLEQEFQEERERHIKETVYKYLLKDIMDKHVNEIDFMVSFINGAYESEALIKLKLIIDNNKLLETYDKAYLELYD